MGLIINISYLNSGIGTIVGGGSPCDTFPNVFKGSTLRHYYFGTFSEYSSIPNTNRKQNSWLLPILLGDIGSLNSVKNYSNIDTANLAAAILLTSTLINTSELTTKDLRALAVMSVVLLNSSIVDSNIAGIVNINSLLVQDSDLIGTINQIISIFATINLTSNLNSSVSGVINLDSILTQGSDLQSTILGIVNLILNVNQTSELTASIIGFWQMVVTAEGTSALISSISAFANIFSNLTSYNTLTLVAGTQYVSITATITTVSGLSVESIANAVWEKLIEGNFSAKQCLEILTAVAAGKTTIEDLGNNAAIVTFRDINDTTNRVVANMTESERDLITFNL